MVLKLNIQGFACCSHIKGVTEFAGKDVNYVTGDKYPSDLRYCGHNSIDNDSGRSDEGGTDHTSGNLHMWATAGGCREEVLLLRLGRR